MVKRAQPTGHSPAPSLPWWCTSLLLAACSQTVVLGSECPDEPGQCLHARIGASDAGAPGSNDAGSGSSSDTGAALDGAEQPLDGETPELEGGALATDAGSAPALALFPTLQNGSFEITRGPAGDIAFQPPGSPALGFTTIEPWQACRAGLQVLSSYEPSGVPPAAALDQETFVLDQYALGNPVGLNQQLSEPLRKGEHYAFSIALRVARDGDAVRLNVFGTSVQCLPNGAPLATSRVIVETTWQRVCMRFTPDGNHLALMLGASAELSGAALLMDDLRYDPACAAP